MWTLSAEKVTVICQVCFARLFSDFEAWGWVCAFLEDLRGGRVEDSEATAACAFAGVFDFLLDVEAAAPGSDDDVGLLRFFFVERRGCLTSIVSLTKVS